MALVRAHRYIGLGLAPFLILEGLTGSLLALRTPLDRVFRPELHVAPRDAAATLPLADLVERAAALKPGRTVDYVTVRADQALVRMHHVDGAEDEQDANAGHGFMLVLDPWTGRELPARQSGTSAGFAAVIDVVYRLHSDLALRAAGAWTLGVVAILWTVDCFVSAYLTFPRGRHRFWPRWRRSWIVRPSTSWFRPLYDLHRAGGLWPWPVLIAFAWSSVMLEPTPVYDWVTAALMDYRSNDDAVAAKPRGVAGAERLDWRAAEATGRRLMADASEREGFTIAAANSLAYIEPLNVYAYGVSGSRDLRAADSETVLWFDASTGQERELFLPTGSRSGDTASSWLRALHFADLRDSAVFRTFVAGLGVWISALSGTGIYVWAKKTRGTWRRPANKAYGGDRSPRRAEPVA